MPQSIKVLFVKVLRASLFRQLLCNASNTYASTTSPPRGTPYRPSSKIVAAALGPYISGDASVRGCPPSTSCIGGTTSSLSLIPIRERFYIRSGDFAVYHLYAVLIPRIGVSDPFEEVELFVLLVPQVLLRVARFLHPFLEAVLELVEEAGQATLGAHFTGPHNGCKRGPASTVSSSLLLTWSRSDTRP